MTTPSVTVAVLSLLLAVGEFANPAEAFCSSGAPSAAFGVLSLPSQRQRTRLPMSSEEEQEPKLVLGSEVEEEAGTLEMKLGALGTEAGYVAAAAKRAEEARAKMLAGQEEEARRAEQEEAYLKDKGEWRRSENYGPGDLSGAGEILVADDGWEKSVGADEDNIIGAQAALGEEGGEEEEPTLFIPSGDDGDGPIVF
uniref:Clathrin light chain n=1 Tax=Odontella aurita TaxID=265563 RepID=A0A7S4N862_9STRA|mmetsp:Transcript_519/g.1595  ORF Transcript_519/g.1595 Transcript_519/m.1595 type:complete len:197 (+) Transcript_519:161-751(+)|eukprot:CAMPEP_0113554540 /NCGR_PEP_ID=MMETSP0015_2-20120614/16208_1 /TAXON_ID=2838 /ORGANISM="Odontella" /LENGTH=196 /DNA_ID=CAMNT_0000455697 /DNA_START=116 /DNA_END=706 /DNA_ORIENTATION=+ /assembly_acc=CAM_ASM_000160